MATMAQLEQALRMADQAGNVEDARALAQAIAERRSAAPKAEESQAPEFDREAYFREMNEELSGPEAFAVGMGRGANRIWRGITGEQEDPATRQAADMLSDDRPSAMIGEVAGMAAPFVVPGMGVGAVKSLGTRALLSGGLGMAEGALISRGDGGDANDQILAAGTGGAIASGLEVLFPVLGRMGRALFRKLGRTPKGTLIDAAGRPSNEFQQALTDAGMTFDDLTDEARSFVARQRAGASPEEAARLARFQSQGIPATMGDISQDFNQQATESRLVSMATGETGEPLRQFRLQQSEAFKSKVDDLVRMMGVPDEAGDSIKAALTGRETLLRGQKNALYKQAAEMSEDVASVPIFGDSLIDALPDERTMRRLGRRQGSQIPALRDLLVEFGIDQSPEAVEEFTKRGGEVFPLTLGNLEDFRTELNALIRADQTGASSVAVGPVLRALDGEADEVAKALERSGVTVGDDLMSTLRQARETTRTLKAEFSPESITGRLIATKRDGVTPVVEASRVFRELETKPVEQVTRTMQSLFNAGPEGRKAIGDIKASVVLNALENGLKAPSRKVSGIETVGGNQFAKYLDKIGEDKLKTIFKGDEKTLRALMALKQTGLDMSPTNAAVPKGSAPVILDAINRFSNLPVMGYLTDFARRVLTTGSDQRAIRRAMNARPETRLMLTQIEREFPSLASAIGIAGIAAQEGEDE